MLVLTRRVGEQIVIGSDIRVTVVAANGRRVRLGITAPLSVPVAREEVLSERGRFRVDGTGKKPRELKAAFAT